MYTVDRIENNIAILENRDTNKIMEINLEKLPKNIKEKDILEYKNNTYIINEQNTKATKNKMRERFNRLKNK